MASRLKLSAEDGHEFSAYHSESSDTPCKGRLVVIQEVFGVNRHIRDFAMCVIGFQRMVSTRSPHHSLIDWKLMSSWAARLRMLPKEEVCGHAWRGKTDSEIRWRALIILPNQGQWLLWTFVTGERSPGWQRIHPVLMWPCVTSAPNIHQFRNHRPQCPVQLHFGALGHMIPLEDVENIKAANLDVCVYPDAGHGFNCNLWDSFHRPSAELAWQRTLDFLSQSCSKPRKTHNAACQNFSGSFKE